MASNIIPILTGLIFVILCFFRTWNFKHLFIIPLEKTRLMIPILCDKNGWLLVGRKSPTQLFKKRHGVSPAFLVFFFPARKSVCVLVSMVGSPGNSTNFMAFTPKKHATPPLGGWAPRTDGYVVNGPMVGLFLSPLVYRLVRDLPYMAQKMVCKQG